jgi:leucyl aminopeptidase
MIAMRVAITSSALASQKADSWVLYSFDKKPPRLKSKDAVSLRLSKMIQGWIEATRFRGIANEVSVFPSWESLPVRFVVLAGLGKLDEFHIGRLERAAAAAARTAWKLNLSHLASPIGGDNDLLPCLPQDIVRAIVRGTYYGRYEFDKFISAKKKRDAGSLTLTDADRGLAILRSAAREAAVTGEVIAEIRDLANLPGNEAYPAIIAKRAATLARKYGVTCRVMAEKELRRERCNAILAVAQGSRRAPCLITLKYRGSRPGLKPLALVGKTITFDTGGISLKPAKSMEWMQFDKSGGMAVLAATLIAARLRVRHPIVGILAAAENMPGGEATRPGDIVRSRSGKTIEIMNTDAEGRLVLADALSLAAEYKPEAIVDIATLTGACVVAFGHVLSAVMGNASSLVEQLKKAGDICGDRLWPMPLLPEYADDIRSPFADTKNTGEGSAGTIIGGVFLQAFVPKDIPWAHIDIAGTAYEEKEKSYSAAGATLFGAKLFVEWIQSLEKAKHIEP